MDQPEAQASLSQPQHEAQAQSERSSLKDEEEDVVTAKTAATAATEIELYSLPSSSGPDHHANVNISRVVDRGGEDHAVIQDEKKSEQEQIQDGTIKSALLYSSLLLDQQRHPHPPLHHPAPIAESTAKNQGKHPLVTDTGTDAKAYTETANEHPKVIRKKNVEKNEDIRDKINNNNNTSNNTNTNNNANEVNEGKIRNDSSYSSISSVSSECSSDASSANNDSNNSNTSSFSQNGEARNGEAISISEEDGSFRPLYPLTFYLEWVSRLLLIGYYEKNSDVYATWIGFWALWIVTCANQILTPMRDAIALAVGVEYMPRLTLASTVLAFCSSVPIGWLFEAPDPQQRRTLKRMGITRGETQGTSLALFYRFFAFSLCSYAIGFKTLAHTAGGETPGSLATSLGEYFPSFVDLEWIISIISNLGQYIYIAFFLVVHLMKLHSLSLVWGVITEAIEYEETARERKAEKEKESVPPREAMTLSPSLTKTRLQRLGFVGFGGTLGGILGSLMASSLAHELELSGLIVLSAIMLECAAQLSIELGRIMQKHWLEQQQNTQSQELVSLDTSMKRSLSTGSMKRVASGNSLSRTRSLSELAKSEGENKSEGDPNKQQRREKQHEQLNVEKKNEVNEDAFKERLLRGVRTILRSRLLMAIFTYNALFASTTVLLSFERAALVASRNDANGGTTKEADTRFLANINMASSVAVFFLQATGFGAYVAQRCGPTKTLSIMPVFRLAGVFALTWWHRWSKGQPPNLFLFLVLDECTRVVNLAVAKPVRESLWRGLSNEARYEAKPIVDTLANRWGAGSAAFFVSALNKILGLLNISVGADGNRNIFGLPPILFLCILVAAWWAAVSVDLGQIRKRIDMELKKVQ